jgi:hypothetical protein
MNWIKQNYEKFILVLVSLLLLAFSVMLIVRALGFHETFKSIQGQPYVSTEIKPIETAAVDAAVDQLENPEAWREFRDRTLFAAERYILVDGVPQKPEAKNIHGEVENEWLEKYGLDTLDMTILEQDSDRDGFTVLDEWNFKTDPTNKDSHPPYWSKLRLKQYIQRKFRLMFSAYTGNPEDPDSITFQLNTLDLQQPTQFLKLGDQIAGTKFKIVGFEHKTRTTEMGLEKDISELALEHIEGGEGVTLVLERIVNSPDSYALFKYLWDGSEFAVKLDRTFSLKPDEATVFKLIDITTAEAVIEDTSSGEKHRIPPLQ